LASILEIKAEEMTLLSWSKTAIPVFLISLESANPKASKARVCLAKRGKILF